MAEGFYVQIELRGSSIVAEGSKENIMHYYTVQAMLASDQSQDGEGA